MQLGALHPATRLARAVQQLRSFVQLHGQELGQLANELAEQQPELAARLCVYRDLQAQESGLLLDELVDLQRDLEQAAQASGDGEVETALAPSPNVDPAAGSPKRAAWLAEQSQWANQPRARRSLFSPRERG